MSRALVLAGFMGAGKSTAARALDAEAIDVDARLEFELGPVADFFDREGEAAFRAHEERVTLTALEEGGTIALGGGALGSPRVREALRDHDVLLLDIDLETAWARARGSDRPLARDRDLFAARYAERAGAYLEAADGVVPGSRLDAVKAAAAALRARPDGARLLWAIAGEAQYPVWVGRGLISSDVWLLDHGRRWCVSDENVSELHAGRVPQLAGLVEIPAGEEHKTLETCGRVWQALAASGATRADHVVAVGGGVVGDLAGFVAACFQRGVPVVQVPTTLVAQVDSSLGGKTGVDLPGAKNYVGAYHQPRAVCIDPETLGTLPPEEFAAGYAEVVKTALIAGGPLWAHVGGGGAVDDHTIFSCALAKLRIVAADERDGGLRQLLNLGHTVGHAIEAVTDYRRYRHGEAVGLGLLAALRLSGQDELRAQVAGLLEHAGLPVALDASVDPEEVVAATAKDKKRLSGATPFVLVDGPGAVRHGAAVDPGQVLAAVRELAA